MLNVLISQTHTHTPGGREETFRGDGSIYGIIYGDVYLPSNSTGCIH